MRSSISESNVVSEGRQCQGKKKKKNRHQSFKISTISSHIKEYPEQHGKDLHSVRI